MSMEDEGRERELRQIIGMLEKTYRIAHEASMTGSLQGGKEYTIQQYNAMVETLGERGIITAGFFPPLSPDASFDTVGVACAQLAEFLRGALPDGGHWKHRGHGRKHVNIIGNVGDLKEIGEIIRESLPEWMRAAREKRERPEAEEEAPPRNAAWKGPSEPIMTPPPTGSPDLADLRGGAVAGASGEASLEELERQMAALNNRIQSIAQQIARSTGSPDEVQRLSDELTRLSQEQAQLAQRSAALRARAAAEEARPAGGPAVEGAEEV